MLLQAGLEEKWWADSMQCYCHLRSVQDLLSDGKTPYERRFGEPLNGPVIPFGFLVEYHPISAKDQSRLHQFGKKVLPGIFALYVHLHAAGRIWKGDFLVADIEELENLDASEIHARRLKDQEVITPKNGESFIFPTADGTIKLSGGPQDVPKSTLIRDQPEEGEELGDDLRESDGSQPKDTMTDDSEVRNGFDRSKEIACMVITLNRELNSMCRRKKHSQYHCDMLCWKAVQTIIGTLMATETYLNLRRVSRSSQ